MVPVLLGLAAAGTALFGAKKMMDSSSNNNRAKELQVDARNIYDSAKNILEQNRVRTNEMLEELGKTKINVWANEMGDFINIFSQFKNVQQEGELAEEGEVSINQETINEYKGAALKASEMLKAGLGTLGAGALAGVAAYGGASMFAAASTGTAISALSGAAATNATLAFFGGGSLATGGLGMAAGGAVLGGVVLAPIMAVAGSLMAAKSEENLAKAEKMYNEACYAAEKMNGMSDILVNIYDISNDYNEFILQFRETFRKCIISLNDAYVQEYDECKKSFWNKLKLMLGFNVKVDYNKITNEHKHILHVAWLMAQTMQKLLTTNLMTDEGIVNIEAKNVLNNSQNLINGQLELMEGNYNG